MPLNLTNVLQTVGDKYENSMNAISNTFDSIIQSNILNRTLDVVILFIFYW